jgi:hypothetical protein
MKNRTRTARWVVTIILAATSVCAKSPEADHDKLAQAQTHAASHAKERLHPDPTPVVIALNLLLIL